MRSAAGRKQPLIPAITWPPDSSTDRELQLRREAKPMPDELDSQGQWKKDQLEDDPEADWQEPHDDCNFGRRPGESLLEMFNPLEAFGEEPALGLAMLVLIAVVFVIWCVGVGLWAAVQEAFFGGGPPQGLGLK